MQVKVLGRLIVSATLIALFTCPPWPKGVEAKKGKESFDRPGLVIGEFRLARHGVLDGDTLRVVGLPKTLRLIGIDTEETFKSEADRALYRAKGFREYLRIKRGNSPRPVKAATPMGEEAKRFAEDFFRDVSVVRLERDHPKEIRGYYGRFLAYVFALKDGRYVNYNVEAVRAGMSPYFVKYGYSRRFHKEFLEAEAEARAAKRGIWDPKKEHYQDYEERIKWWKARADFLQAFEREAEGREDYVALTHFDAIDRLWRLVGREAVVLGQVGKVQEREGVVIVYLARRKNEDFPVVFFDRQVFERCGIAKYEGEYVKVKGRVAVYRPQGDRSGGIVELVVSRPEDVKGMALFWEKKEER